MFDLAVSFLLTWLVVLAPPAAVRLVRRRPLAKGAALALSGFLYFGNVLLFSAPGSQSRSHAALVLGAIVSFYIYRRPANEDSPGDHNPRPKSDLQALSDTSPRTGQFNRRTLAREWLIFLGAFVVGLIVVPPVAATIEDLPVSLYYSDLVTGDQWLLLWLLLLLPYIAIQLFRSVAWAIRQLRN